MQGGTTTQTLSRMLHLLPTLLVLCHLPMASMTSKCGSPVWPSISSGTTWATLQSNLQSVVSCRRSEETSKLICCKHPILLPRRVTKEISQGVKCSAYRLANYPQEAHGCSCLGHSTPWLLWRDLAYLKTLLDEQGSVERGLPAVGARTSAWTKAS